jgi:hypothetical protein
MVFSASQRLQALIIMMSVLNATVQIILSIMAFPFALSDFNLALLPHFLALRQG